MISRNGYTIFRNGLSKAMQLLPGFLETLTLRCMLPLWKPATAP